MFRLISAVAVLALIAIAYFALRPAPESESDRRVGPAARPVPIESLALSPTAFDASRGGSVTLRFQTLEDGAVTVRWCGPNREVWRVDGPRETVTGIQMFEWDGRDERGEVVPNEAFFPVVSIENDEGVATLDPTRSTGGIRLRPTKVSVRPRDEMISYVLPEPARVLIRIGSNEGPMMRTLVNWSPRAKGLCTEGWDGWDVDRLVRVGDDPETVVSIQAYSLPNPTVFTIGSGGGDYVGAYMRLRESLEHLEAPERALEEVGAESPHWGRPVHLDRDPSIRIVFPEVSSESAEVPEVGRPALLTRVELGGERQGDYLREQGLEVVLFADQERILEAEIANLPYQFEWDLGELGPGEHLLTVNAVSFRQHVGVASRTILVGELDGASDEGAGAGGEE